jgi:hypothetical protein
MKPTKHLRCLFNIWIAITKKICCFYILLTTANSINFALLNNYIIQLFFIKQYELWHTGL